MTRVAPDARFASKVDIGAGPDACWEWRGTIDRETGYGKFWLEGRSVGAHRAAWSLFLGPIGGGLDVLHRCDNRTCVRLGHFFLGTNADNVADKMAKGREARGVRSIPLVVHRGEAVGTARLSEDDVLEIRRAAIAGERQRELAVRFGVAQTTISAVVRAKNWRHLAEGAGLDERDRREALRRRLRLD